MKIKETGPLYRRWRLFVRVVTRRRKSWSVAETRLWRVYGGWYEAVERYDIHGDWTVMEMLRDEVYGG